MEPLPSLGAFLRSRRLVLRADSIRLGAYERLPMRVGRPVTQEELAEAAGVTRSWYTLLELGAARPSRALANRLADALALGPAERLMLVGLAMPDLGPALRVAERRLSEDIFEVPPPSRTEPVLDTGADFERATHVLARARERFLAEGEVQPGLRPRIVNSWLRSRDFTPPSSSQSDFGELRTINERLLRAARPILAFLSDRLSGSGYVVILTDHRGRLLEVEGDRILLRRLARVGLSAGGDFSEEAIGTNAIGSAIVERRPLQVMASEHLAEPYCDLTCTAVPIRIPETLQVLGALDITARNEPIRGDLLALGMRCALEIEEALGFPEPQTRSGRPSEPPRQH
jgi:transcriptional regulator with XRE-family HTH domain